MPTRFTYLRNVQSMHVQPRQPIPEEFQVQAEGDCGDAYLMWLYCEIKQVREAFAEQISAAVSELNKATRPSDLGLSAEKFPFKIWRSSTRSRSAVRMDDELTLGEILEHRTRAHSKHSFVTRVESALIEVQPSGMLERMEVNLRAGKIRVNRAGVGALRVYAPTLKLDSKCKRFHFN